MTVLTVTPNPAEDRVAELDSWPPGGTIRPTRVHSSPGGKGVNVARALRILGRRVMTTGLCGGRRGHWLVDALTAEGLRPSFSHIAGETRVTYTLAGPQGETVVVSEPGPKVSEREFRGFLAHLRGSLLGGASFLVVSGSLPEGLPPEAVGELVDLARGLSRPILVDTSGPALLAALTAGADLVKANLEECVAAGLVCPEAGMGEAAEALVSAGAKAGIVTDGSEGAAWSGDGRLEVVEAPRVDVVSAVGAGDVFTAALVDSLLAGHDVSRAMRRAAAAGAAACLDPRAGFLDPERFRELSP